MHIPHYYATTCNVSAALLYYIAMLSHSFVAPAYLSAADTSYSLLQKSTRRSPSCLNGWWKSPNSSSSSFTPGKKPIRFNYQKAFINRQPIPNHQSQSLPLSKTPKSLMGLSNALFHRRVFNDQNIAHSRKIVAPEEGFPDVAAELKSRIQTLYTTYLSPDGTGVDYKGLRKSKEFEEYVRATTKLARVDKNSLINMSHGDKISFFINIYNALTIHSNVIRGHPETSLGRIKFNVESCYNVGGLIFSLSDIEHGILRANSTFLVFGRPFKKNDERLKIMLNKVEPRIHFALNCGAKSCPPILYFTRDNLEFGLEAATQSFLEDDDNLIVLKDENKVKASMIFKWYIKDFAKSLKTEDVVKWIVKNMDEESEKRKMLMDLLKSDGGKKIKLKYLPYNWDRNEMIQ